MWWGIGVVAVAVVAAVILYVVLKRLSDGVNW